MSISKRYTHQTGAVLITGLIFLIVLTMLGVTAARIATLEGRMSGNMRDRALALQAADLALRDAEVEINASFATRDPKNDPGSNWSDYAAANCNGDGIAGSLDDGLCYTGQMGDANPVWQTISLTDWPSVPYGRFTFAAAIDCQNAPSQDCVSAPPRYIIEAVINGAACPKPANNLTVCYRVTARSQGKSPTTWVILQEIYRYR
jgi:type IV pilus assembly protein PilX